MTKQMMHDDANVTAEELHVFMKKMRVEVHENS